MRTRLSKSDRRTQILTHAARLFADRGLSGTEMEDIRRACGVSRGGLYHHFANKRAVLDALVAAEVTALAETLDDVGGLPILALLQHGASHLGAPPGLLAALRTDEDRLDYLSSLQQAQAALLGPALHTRLAPFVRPGTDPAHVAELFVTINTHINRRQILGQWSASEAAGFAATALSALAPLLRDPAALTSVISDLLSKANS